MHHDTVVAIEFSSVVFRYPNRPVSLQDISFTIRPGRRVAIVGPNGAGKTTLLLMCNGTIRPTSGSVSLFGTPLAYDLPSLREVRRRVGMVFQNSDIQLFAPTVYQDVAFGPLNLGLPPGEIMRRVQDALYAVGLSGYDRRPPHQLSGGEKKRVAIAGVLAMEPDILVLDEPTSSLDPAGAAEVIDLLDELHARGSTVLISTHDVDLAYSWADEVILMSGGRMIFQGSPGHVFADQKTMQQARLVAPPLLQLYQHLAGHGLIAGGDPPLSMAAFARRIEEACHGGPYLSVTGRVTIVDADALGDRPLTSALPADRSIWTGAMGTTAKRRAESEGIPIDFSYGVVDKCLLRVILGEDVLIIVSGPMVRRVVERIGAYSTEIGHPIAVEQIPPPA